MSVGDIYRVALLQRVSTSAVVNVFHYRTTVSVGLVEEEVQAVGEAVAEDCLTAWEAANHSGVVWDTVSVRGVTNPTLGADITVNGQGNQAGTLLPFQTSTECLWRTGLFGRSFRGKSFWAPSTEENQQNGVIAQAQLDLYDALADSLKSVDFLSFSGLFRFELGVYSRTLTLFTPVTTHFNVPTLRTQRRRTPGFGS